MIRATTGSVLKSYRFNLMNSFINQNNAMNTVLTQRTFNSFAEDPASAAKTFRLRKSRMTVNSQLSICQDTLKKYETAYNSLQSIDDVLDTKDGVYGAYMKTLKGATLEWLNDPTGDAREQLTKVLDQTSELVIQDMNQKYGDNFIFAGADGRNVPFEVREENGQNKLYYRGVCVDAAVPNVLTQSDPNDPTADPLLLECDKNGLVTEGGGFYLMADSVSYMDPADYPDMYSLYTDTTAGELVEFNSDGTVYDPTDSTQVGGYYARVDTSGASGDDPATTTKVDPDTQLISKADFEAYQEACGGNVTEVTADFVPPPHVLYDDDGAGNLIPFTIDGSYVVINNDSALISTDDYDAQKLEAEKLEYLANEKYFVDIGLGFQEDENGKLIESSGFNASLNGITFLGYGLDEDGDPKNIYSIVQRLTEISESVPEGGSWDAVWPEFDRLVGKLETACSNFKTEFTNLAASTTKLENNEELLTENKYNLTLQYSGIEDVDEVDAICSFIWAQYAYNAALKVGNSVLSQSLMDYLS